MSPASERPASVLHLKGFLRRVGAVLAVEDSRQQHATEGQIIDKIPSVAFSLIAMSGLRDVRGGNGGTTTP